MRRTPLAIAAGVLAVLGVIAGGLALLISDLSPRPLGIGAVSVGTVAAIAAATLIARRARNTRVNRGRSMVGNGRALPLAVVGLALASAAAGDIALFLGYVLTLAWVVVAVSATVVIFGVLWSMVDDDDWLGAAVFTAGFGLVGGAVYGIVLLFRAGHPGWATVVLGGLLVALAMAVLATMTQDLSLGEPGPRIPAIVGWIGPVIAVGTAMLIQKGHETTLPVAAYAAAQLVVQQAVLYVLLPVVGRCNLPEIAAAARRRVHRGSGSNGPYDLLWELRQQLNHTTERAERQRLERELLFLEERNERQRFADSNSIAAGGSLLLLRDHVQSVRSALLLPAAARTAVASLARTHGIVLDELWPRVELVVAASVRRRVAWLDRGIALSRVAAASSIGSAVTLAIAGQYSTLAVPAVVFAIAVVAGRKQVGEAYTGKVAAADVHRMDLVRTLGLRPPHTDSELVALGAVLAGQRPDAWQDDPIMLTGSSRPAQESTDPLLAEQLREIVSGELHAGLERLTQQQQILLAALRQLDLGTMDLEQIAIRIADRTAVPLTNRVEQGLIANLTTQLTELQAQLSASVVTAVETAMTGPELVNFDGYLAVELDTVDHADTEGDSVGGLLPVTIIAPGAVSAPAGTTVALSVSLISDPQASDAAPDRRRLSNGPFVALETVTVEGGRTEAMVPFDVLVDSATMTPAPHRISLRVTRLRGEQTTVLTLDLPEAPGVHEAWLQLIQSGRLVQAVVLTVDARG